LAAGGGRQGREEKRGKENTRKEGKGKGGGRRGIELLPSHDSCGRP